MDHINKEKRSYNMSKVRSKNTKLELLVRHELFKKGFRYRIYYDLPGKPDIVFVSKKKVIFINGCFWHQHGCKKSKLPKTNKKFWKKKLSNNRKRDLMNLKKLKEQGWETYVIWECELHSDFENQIKNLIKWIKWNEDKAKDFTI